MSLLQQQRFPNNTVTCSGLATSRYQSTLRHIQQNDAWSCGFRNLQMLLTAAVPLLRKDHSYYEQQTFTRDAGYVSIPTFKQLQHSMEQAWTAGFDPKSAQHYGHKIVGKRAQIGALEVSYCLIASGIECAVVQFIHCRESRSQLGPFCAAYFAKKYHGACPYCSIYAGSSSSRAIAQQLLLSLSQGGNNAAVFNPTCQCPSIPLYLQWKGHSVTVVGVETYANSDKVKNLLLFDPAASGSKLTKALSGNDLKPFRKSVASLEKKDCQIVLTSTKTLSYFEREQLKTNTAHCLTAAEEAVTRTL